VLRGFWLLLLCAATASAQAVGTAQLNGTVRDEGGLVLPGVTITVTNTDTGLARTVVTNETGSYVLQNLPVGPYRFEASLQGFRTYAQTGIVLQVGANPTLAVVLGLGQLEETVTVEGNAALVETRNPGVGQVITNEQVLELPLNGRQLTELVFQAGLATGGSGGSDAPSGGMLNTNIRSYPNTTIVVAGGLSNGMTYSLDGGTHNDPYNNLSLPLPFPDAMQEFKVETSALSAQYGHHSAAAVNAVTKSGTNVMRGNVFEFMRDDSLNATNAFAAIGEDGKRRSDGLRRDQFGGTLGGPVVTGRMFFFGAYQGTRINVTPTSFFQFVPTPAMMAGDFTAIASPECNAGRTITLRAPFVGNRVTPSLFSPAARNLQARLPQPINECGQVFFDRKTESLEHIGIGRVDYQLTNNHSIFGRYQLAQYGSEPDNDPDNVLAYANGPINDTIHSVVIGDTSLLGSSTVNSFRVAYNSTDIRKEYEPYFDHGTLGIRNVAIPLPGFGPYSVSGGFSMGPSGARPSKFSTTALQVGDDFSVVRGRHQLGVGANFIRSAIDAFSIGAGAGNFAFNGSATGLGLADFLLGRPSAFTQLEPYTPKGHLHYFGAYVQDAWTVTSNLTLNVGLRWEPSFQYVNDLGHFNHFSLEWFRSGVRSTRFVNAPVGVLYDGDPGLETKSALGNVAPRLAAVWDPQGDGRMTVRAAWGRFFDLPHMQYFAGFDRLTPFGTEISVTNAPFDDPWANTPGGNPFPIVERPDMTFPPYGGFITLPLEPEPPYSDQWNLSLQRQLGASWMVSANYLASRGHRLPVGDQLNPAIYSPGATTGTTNQRRRLVLEDPVQGQFYGEVIDVKSIGISEYNALMLSVQHRAARGFSLSGNYTLSECTSDPVNYEPGIAGIDLTKPGDVAHDRGSCGQSDQRHVANLSLVYQLPGPDGGMLGALTRDWQVSAIVSARSGRHFDVTTGVDNALNGQGNQRPNQISDDVYAKDGLRWLNPAAFQAPAPGTYGNLQRNSLVGPRRLNVDMGVSRSFRFAGTQQIQFRGEVFNVLNRVHYSDPVSALNNGRFGLITSAGDPRIIQLALKYAFWSEDLE
jgi:outer membrane receptor protein involved in Fe transport